MQAWQAGTYREEDLRVSRPVMEELGKPEKLRRQLWNRKSRDEGKVRNCGQYSIL